MKSYIILTTSLTLQIGSKINCMIRLFPAILTGSNDAFLTQMPMQEDDGYVARRTVSKG